VSFPRLIKGLVLLKVMSLREPEWLWDIEMGEGERQQMIEKELKTVKKSKMWPVFMTDVLERMLEFEPLERISFTGITELFEEKGKTKW
jgi:hypothetical protein